MMEKRWILQSADPQTVQHLQEVLKIDTTLCQLLVQRGITTFDAAKAFFRPQLTDLHDPFLMQDMDKAIARLDQAIEQQEKILLYGDYDVDGTTSIALMYAFLQPIYSNIDYYVPDRYKEGYGVSMQGIDFAAQHGFSLIIAMDCGVKAIKQVAYAASKDIDFIICDHHLPEGKLPDAVAVLDPKRPDCAYPYKGLSGCGVSFKLAQAYYQKHKQPLKPLFQLLDLLVVSIGCDIVPVTGENRILAHYGLKQLNENPRQGLQTLISSSERSYPLSIGDIVFGIGPLINAAGRIGDAKQAVKLLLSTDKKTARQNAEVLEYRNTKRRELEKNMAIAATQQHQQQQGWENAKSVVLYNENWHKGVVGIVAARMVETFYRPSIVLTASNGKMVGSARSVAGFNIYEALKSCEDLLVNFGGHKHAAGLTILKENYIEFCHRFEEYAQASLAKEQLVPEIKVNAQVEFKDITPKFWRILKQFAPFGPHNMRPVFSTLSVKDTGYSKVLKGEHLKFYVEKEEVKYKGIGFRLGAYYTDIQQRPFHLCYTLQENNWKGKRSLELMVKDVKV